MSDTQDKGSDSLAIQIMISTLVIISLSLCAYLQLKWRMNQLAYEQKIETARVLTSLPTGPQIEEVDYPDDLTKRTVVALGVNTEMSPKDFESQCKITEWGNGSNLNGNTHSVSMFCVGPNTAISISRPMP
ncbi:MAG TPA: hypothetical protein VHQ41_01590 [Patescibacteria group bacterium]|jgi:hypothetical protein|nr:hypothetical protein [Patescibacteria group bacterium]